MKNNDYNLNDEPNLPLDNNGNNPFDLPADYFSNFEDKLKQRLESESELNEFPVLSSIQKNNTFLVPDHYFGSLEHSLNYKIELVEELNSYKTLSALEKVNPFTLSADYFENFTVSIKERIYSTKQSKSSALDTILGFIFGKTMAFSFGLTLIVGLAFYFNQSPESVVETGDCKTLACLERQEILSNNNVITNLDEDQLMDLVDVNSLHKQLNQQKENSSVNKNIHPDSITEDDILNEL